MADTLQITDGTTTLDLSGAAGYHLIRGRWAPQVSHKMELVVETIELLIKGSNAADATDKLHDLIDLMEQADRWDNGEIVDAVQIKYKPDGSSLTNPIYSVILGSPPGESAVSPPADFDAVSTNNFIIKPVTLRFRRQARWLSDSETETSSVSSGNPAILTPSTFTNALKTLCPYDAKLDYTRAAADHEPSSTSRIFQCFTNSADKLQIVEGEDFDSSISGAIQAVTEASGGNVGRISASTGLDYFTFNATNFSGFNSTIRKIYVLAMVRNNSSAVPAETWIKLAANTTAPGYTSRKQKIEYTNAKPIMAVYGPIPIPQEMSNLLLTFYISWDSGSSLSFDLDYFGLIGADDNLRVVEITNYPYATSGHGYRTTIKHLLDERLDPAVYVDDGGAGAKIFAPYGGVARLEAAGNTISCLVMGHDPDASIAQFYIEDATGELDIQLTVDRLDAYLAPV